MKAFACTLIVLFCHCAFAAPPKSHQAEMSWLDNGTIRLGVDLNLGGAVTHLSRSKSDVNLINSWDWGRQVQMSYYAGPVPFTPRGKQPAKVWRGLGWNPIQAGDHFGNSSRVIEHRNDGKSIYVKCVPMQWPLDNEPGECTFETWYELNGAAVRVRAALNNDRSDKTQWPARAQELPAVYTNGPFHRLLTYTGDKPFTGGDLIRIEHQLGQDGAAWGHWLATENWAALVNDDGWGLGVWNPGAYSFSGGFAGKPGKGGPGDDPTGYIAPNREEILDWNVRHEYAYTLIVGDLKSIRDYVYQHAQRPAPPNYRFDKDRQGWWYSHATDAGWPISGELKITPTGEHPSLIGPDAFWPAADGPVLYVRAAFKTGQANARVFWTRLGEKAMASMTFPIIPDGQYRTYEVRLADSPEYKGVITGLRLELAEKGSETASVRVQAIGFRKL
ncbi:MAG TPA: hypothetical protein VH475_28785 [Tepidisphaeraceae bacterium]